MRVLVIHDREEVATEIQTLVTDTLGGDAVIDVADDYHSAKVFLSTHIYDVAVFDLTIPFQKGQASDFQAIDLLLKELFKFGVLNVPGDVIGITKEPSAVAAVANSIGAHLMATIPEDESGVWRRLLAEKLNYAVKSWKTRNVIVNRHYDYDVLIFTALDKEIAPYAEHFDLIPIKHFPGANAFMFRDKDGIPRRGVTFSVGESGQPSAASYGQSLISTFRPRLAIMTGICGGIKQKVKLGDVIFFEAAYAWDYGKWSERKDRSGEKASVFVSRPNPIDIKGTQVHRIARDLVLNPLPELRFEALSKKFPSSKLKNVSTHICPAASGSAVVANDQIASQIRGLNDSIWAIDMEAYGFYHAGTRTNVVQPQILCVKAVSDYCNGQKGDGLHSACVYISSVIALHVITCKFSFNTQ